MPPSDRAFRSRRNWQTFSKPRPHSPTTWPAGRRTTPRPNQPFHVPTRPGLSAGAFLCPLRPQRGLLGGVNNVTGGTIDPRHNIPPCGHRISADTVSQATRCTCPDSATIGQAPHRLPTVRGRRKFWIKARRYLGSLLKPSEFGVLNAF